MEHTLEAGGDPGGGHLGWTRRGGGNGEREQWAGQ